MARKKIVLVGFGNIGSRHLQSLCEQAENVGHYLEIHVIEPNTAAIKAGMERINYPAILNKAFTTVAFQERLSEQHRNPDVCIIATNSKDRVQIFDLVLELGCTKILSEKYVCQSVSEYDHILDNMARHGAKGWINCNLRYFDDYQETRLKVHEEKLLSMLVWGGDYGLGTNAIHYVDLFNFFTGSDDDIELNSDLLDSEIRSNKRGPNYVEFSGCLIAKKKNGSSCAIISHENSNAPNIISLLTGNHRYLIEELRNKSLHSSKDGLWEWQMNKFRFLHASQLTYKIVKDILDSDTCRLTTLEDSYFTHKELFQAFNRHIEKVTGQNPLLCPIT